MPLTPEEDFQQFRDGMNEIRAVLAEVARRQEAAESKHERDFAEIHATFAEIGEIQRRQAAMMLDQSKMLVEHQGMIEKHDRMMADHDERMERVARHLEVLIAVVD